MRRENPTRAGPSRGPPAGPYGHGPPIRGKTPRGTGPPMVRHGGQGTGLPRPRDPTGRGSPARPCRMVRAPESVPYVAPGSTIGPRPYRYGAGGDRPTRAILGPLSPIAATRQSSRTIRREGPREPPGIRTRAGFPRGSRPRGGPGARLEPHQGHPVAFEFHHQDFASAFEFPDSTDGQAARGRRARGHDPQLPLEARGLPGVRTASGRSRPGPARADPPGRPGVKDPPRVTARPRGHASRGTADHIRADSKRLNFATCVVCRPKNAVSAMHNVKNACKCSVCLGLWRVGRESVSRG